MRRSDVFDANICSVNDGHSRCSSACQMHPHSFGHDGGVRNIHLLAIIGGVAIVVVALYLAGIL
jgi:hypothetical protein